ncbi:hypothetical protein HK100_004670 [Physocladia obscura]|uniref:Uncharacterized protein n=1 Tax=Physocladia obscura TaxID=109957 RepID=A0AAD5STK1_9FUNG|nr:hypothetical protein HK100_004670 [Physocladia obscura]
MNIESSTETEFITKFELRKENECVMVQEASDVKGNELKVRAYTIQIVNFVRELSKNYATCLCFVRSFPDEHEFIGTVKEIKSGKVCTSVQVHPHFSEDILVGTLYLVHSKSSDEAESVTEDEKIKLQCKSKSRSRSRKETQDSHNQKDLQNNKNDQQSNKIVGPKSRKPSHDRGRSESDRKHKEFCRSRSTSRLKNDYESQPHKKSDSAQTIQNHEKENLVAKANIHLIAVTN